MGLGEVGGEGEERVREERRGGGTCTYVSKEGGGRK